MVSFDTILLVAFISATMPMVSASKDPTYYKSRFTNPNTKHKMYWKDSSNVLEDLSKFSSLYIQHHGCVYGHYDRSDEDHHSGSQDQDDDATQSDYFAPTFECGGDGDEESNWYMGKSLCFKPQSAFSLYGVLKNSPQSWTMRKNFCNRGTYIDTYYTTKGIEAIGIGLGLTTKYYPPIIETVTSYNSTYGNYSTYTTSSYPEEDYVYNYTTASGFTDGIYSTYGIPITSVIPSSNCSAIYGQVDTDEDGYVEDENGEQFESFASYASYGLGCSAGKYVFDQFEGAFCRGDRVMDTLNTFDEFNSAMNNVKCEQIYDSKAASRRVLQEAVDDVNDGEVEEGYDDAVEEEDTYDADDDAVVEEDIDLLSILKYSRSCVVNVDSECPDPYGIKTMYAAELDMALRRKAFFQGDAVMRFFGWVFIAGSAIFIIRIIEIFVRRVINYADRKIKDLKERKVVEKMQGEFQDRMLLVRSASAATLSPVLVASRSMVQGVREGLKEFGKNAESGVKSATEGVKEFGKNADELVRSVTNEAFSYTDELFREENVTEEVEVPRRTGMFEKASRSVVSAVERLQLDAEAEDEVEGVGDGDGELATSFSPMTPRALSGKYDEEEELVKTLPALAFSGIEVSQAAADTAAVSAADTAAETAADTAAETAAMMSPSSVPGASTTPPSSPDGSVNSDDYVVLQDDVQTLPIVQGEASLPEPSIERGRSAPASTVKRGRSILSKVGSSLRRTSRSKPADTYAI